MRYGRPLLLRQKYWTGIEAEIQRLFNELIYIPLAESMKRKPVEVMNSSSALMEAVANGTVWYDDGHFVGAFNSKITKELRALGAMWNQASKTWSLVRDLIPAQIRTAQAQAEIRYNALRHSMMTTLEGMNIESIDQFSTTEGQYGRTIEWMNDDFEKAVKSISIPPKLTVKQKQIISDEWGQNLNLYIKEWAAENILELRGKIQANTFVGGRSAQLVDMIRQNYQVSQRKAKFLARQETSLLLSKFRQTRYEDIGSYEYKWSGANDERERPDHKALNNKIYSYSLPPITDRRTGARNNPGEDYGCRCVAIPIFR